jgi:hypothetical protein
LSVAEDVLIKIKNKELDPSDESLGIKMGNEITDKYIISKLQERKDRHESENKCCK